MPLCLNHDSESDGKYTRQGCKYRIAQIDKQGNIIKTFSSFFQIMEEMGLTRKFIQSRLTAKYYMGELFFRRIDSKGIIINPLLPPESFVGSKIPVDKLDDKLNIVHTYTSVTEAAASVGCDRRTLRPYLSGGQPYKGFTFRYSKARNNNVPTK